MLSFLKKLLNKKGGKIKFFLPFFIFVLCSCGHMDPRRFGRVTLHDGSDKTSFIFSVNDDFLRENLKSPADKKYAKMSEAEAKLLLALMKINKYCIKNGEPDYVVNSRQEKIYDMTFAHLIEQSYNARPIAPRTYFGVCNK